MKKKYPYPRDGFTLIEALVGLAVVLVLLSIVVASIGAVVDRAKKLESTSNMRSIVAALNVYANDNGGQFPPGRPDAVDGSGGWGSADRSNFWMGQITPYIAGEPYDTATYRRRSQARGIRRDFEEVFYCPQSENPHPYGSFGLNPVMFPKGNDGTLENKAIPGPRRANITDPAKTVLLIDAAPLSGDYDSNWTLGAPRRRPDGTTNISFFDGRVENFDFEEISSRIDALYNPQERNR